MAADPMMFQCIICLDTPKDAVETDCCGQTFCLTCIDQLETKDCPHCRKPDITHHVSWFIRRAIENATTECPNKCGVKVKAFDVKGHSKWCANNNYECPAAPNCDFKGQRSEFVVHLTRCHMKELVGETTRLFTHLKVDQATQCERELLPFTSDPKFDPSLSYITNDDGKIARLGENGKYYCGSELDCPVEHLKCCSCVCCKRISYVCGPGAGCNCESCMRLDIKSRGLQKGWLVNCVGASAKCLTMPDGNLRGFTCGRRSDAKHSRAKSLEPYCGSTQGQSCLDCEYLTQHVVSGLYVDILLNLTDRTGSILASEMSHQK